jgi:hypothetical protein
MWTKQSAPPRYKLRAAGGTVICTDRPGWSLPLQAACPVTSATPGGTDPAVVDTDRRVGGSGHYWNQPHDMAPKKDQT